jgi:predicted nucleic acid-binding protein
LRCLPYDFFQTTEKQKPGLFKIRDKDDYPMLYSAIMAKVDIFITGDMDFDTVVVEKPEILTPAQFLERY